MFTEPSSEQYETPDVVPTISASAAAAAVEVVQDAYEEEIYANEEIDTVVSAQPPGDNGLCARALYDYQAGLFKHFLANERPRTH